MAARKRKIRHDENTREKIRASQLINRLQDHILGKVDMSATQVSAALGLLRKTLPDLATQQIEHSGEIALERIERVIVDERPALTFASDGADNASPGFITNQPSSKPTH